MTKLPAPFVKPDVNLQKYTWIKLDIVALTNSDTWRLAAKVPFAGYAAINLWMAAWHQVPAGSIPADQDWIKKRADVSDEAWKKVRGVALRNFIKCSDGRLYHKALCAMVNEVWTSKKVNIDRTRKARETYQEMRKNEKNEKKEGVTTSATVKPSDKASVSKETENHPLSQGSEKDDALSQGYIENRKENREEEERDYRLSRAPARGGGDSDAESIRAEFLRLREHHWPHDCNLPAPTMTLDVVARDWLDDGVPVALACEVMDRVMTKNVNDGKKMAPTNLKFCAFTVENAYIEYKKTGKLPDRPGAPAPDRDPEREDLLFAAAGIFSREEFLGISIDAMSNEQISTMIAERQGNDGQQAEG